MYTSPRRNSFLGFGLQKLRWKGASKLRDKTDKRFTASWAAPNASIPAPATELTGASVCGKIGLWQNLFVHAVHEK